MPDLRKRCVCYRKESGRYSARRGLFAIPYHMVQHGRLDVPRDWCCHGGSTKEHLKERVRDSVQQQGGEK
jgi:hypothetical protein